MKICYQKKKQVIYSEACPEETLRALAADQETKLLTKCCRLAKRYAEQEEPEAMPQWFATRFMKYCKDMTKEQGANFQNKTHAQKLQLFSAYEKGEHPFINFFFIENRPRVLVFFQDKMRSGAEHLVQRRELVRNEG